MDRKEIIEKARKEIEHIDKHARHEEKILTALSWVNTFHFSSAAIIDYITQNCRRGFASKLIKRGFLIEKETYLGYPWAPHKILVLSREGREFLSWLNPNIDKDDIWVGKIAPGHIFHDYFIQFYIAKYFDFSIIKEIKINAKFNYKIYDAAILTTTDETTDNDKVIAIEIELSRKKTYEVSNVFYNISIDLLQGNVDEARIVYIEGKETIKNKFTKFMINSFNFITEDKYIFYKYERNLKGKYERTAKKIEIPTETLRIEFIKLLFPPKLCEPKKTKIEEELGIINL